MNPEKKLGRGLDFLLSETAREGSTEEMLLVPVEEIRPNRFQPRKEFPAEELEALKASIQAHGILQPLVARRTEVGFELVAGERRLRAAKLAGLKVVPLVVRDLTDHQLLAMALVENIQRADLNALEKARAYAQLLQLTGKTQEEVAQGLGMSRPALANFLRLLELPPEVQEHVSRGTLSMGHARALLALKDPKAMILLAQECVEKGLSVRELESRIRKILEGKKEKSRKERPLPAWHRDLEERLSHALGVRVKVKFRGKKGQILIETPDKDTFDHLFERLTRLEDSPSEEGGVGEGEYLM